MINKKMAVRYCKISVVIFVLCFTVVQLASLVKKDENDPPLPHLKRDDSDTNKDNQLPNDNVQQPINDKGDLLINNESKDQKQKLDIDLHVGDSAKKVNPDVQNDLEKQPQLEKPDEEDAPLIVQEVIANNQDSQIEEPKHKVDIENPDPNAKDGEDEQDEEGDDNEDDEEEEEDDDEFPAHKLVDGKRLSLNDLQPPDHMDAVRIEQDGHLNKEYKKEIFIGNHEEFEQQSDIDPEALLEQIFKKVDKDSDHFITLLELEEWIILKVQEHFSEAMEEAERIFKHLDTHNKGSVSWQDFHIHFLVAKGHDFKTAKKHAADYETIALDPDDKERLIRYKFRWAEADDEPQDNVLTMQEFKAFRHPEQSKLMLDRMVQDIIDSLDQNNDREITEEEFVALPPGEVDGQFIESDKAWQEERRKEYRMVIDINHDEKVTREELKNYVDPQNPNHGRLEAENLIQLADQNADNKLSLDEVLNNPELFLGSKMVDTGRNFHDEF